MGEQEMKKVMILDETAPQPIELTLWKNFAKEEYHRGDLLALTRVRVSDFNGRNLNTYKESKIDRNTIDKDENMKYKVTKLRERLNNFEEELKRKEEGISTHFQSFENKETISERKENIPHEFTNSPIKNETIQNPKPSIFEKEEEISYMKDILDSMEENKYQTKPVVVKIKATISHISHNDKNFYPGCINGECQKKLSEQRTGKWICNGCGKEYERPKYCYALNIKVKDCSCEYWIDLFGKSAELLMQCTANEYRELLLNQDENTLREISNRLEFEDYYFYVKPKFNFYNGVTKKKLMVTKFEKVQKEKEAYSVIQRVNNKLINIQTES